MCSDLESCEKDMTNNSQAGKLIGRSMVGKNFLNVLLTLLLIFPAALASADEIHDPKRVLTIFVFKQGLPWALVETEFLDAQTNDRVAVVIDERTGKKYKVHDGLTKWGYTKDVFDFWAKRLRKFMDEAHGK